MTPPRPLWKSVQDYVMIAIGMISYAIGWNVFLLPTNVTASGLPGISSIIYWATGCPVQIPYFIVNATLLMCAFKILGSKVLCQDCLCRYSGNHPDLFLLQPFRRYSSLGKPTFMGCFPGCRFLWLRNRTRFLCWWKYGWYGYHRSHRQQVSRHFSG